MSANGGTDAAGGTNRGRNFDFNTFASELFNNITVRKIGLGGNRGRFARRHRRSAHGSSVRLRWIDVAGGVQLGYNDLSEDIRPARHFPGQQYMG